LVVGSNPTRLAESLNVKGPPDRPTGLLSRRLTHKWQPILEPMRRPWVLLVSSGLAGLLVGWLMSSLPAPSTVATFWVGNLSSPWAVLAFIAGFSQRSRIWAAAAGLVAEVACVAGFYAKLLFVDPDHLGLPHSTAPLTLIGTGVSHWLWFIAPWVGVAIGAGVVYGLLGRWWGESRSIVAGVAIAVPFIVEPVAWRAYVGFGQGPLALWLVEAAVGTAILGWVIAARWPRRNRGSLR
jgi:hypothetical protein